MSSKKEDEEELLITAKSKQQVIPIRSSSNGDRSGSIDTNKKDDVIEAPTLHSATSSSSSSSSSRSTTEVEGLEYREEEENEETSSSSSSSSISFLEEKEMPLLKYARLVGSLPRNSPTTDNTTTQQQQYLSKVCTSSTMGKVIINNTKRTYDILALGFLDGTVQIVDIRTGLDLCPILTVDTTTTTTSTAKTTKTATTAATTTTTMLNSITSLSFDAFASTLAASQRNGSVAIWELKWIPAESVVSSKSTPSATETTATSIGTSTTKASSSAASNIGQVQQGKTSMEALRNYSAQVLSQYGPKLLSSSSSISSVSPPFRYSYGLSSTPTCLAVDPAYSRKREKQLICGFSDGRVILTKKNLNLVSAAVTSGATKSIMGGLFSGWTKPTIDSVIYQGKVADTSSTTTTTASGTTPASSSINSCTASDDGSTSTRIITNATTATCGIEVVSWRGNLVVWVDVTGIKVFDVEIMTRLAHIDRPTGARASLYHPTISALKCNLCWESSTSILIGWGDCLMNLKIIDEEYTATTTSTSGGTANVPSASADSLPFAPSTSLSTDLHTSIVNAPIQQQQQPLRKRTVDCVMAWELDCVACGVAPMDTDHVAVLGLVIPELNDHDVNDNNNRLEQQRSDTNPSNNNDHTGLTEPRTTFAPPSVELQIISRSKGTIESSDALPLLYPPYAIIECVSTSEFRLLSSYTTPRRDDRSELLELSGRISPSSSSSFNLQSSKESRLEMYQQWSIDRVLCKSDAFHHPDINRSPTATSSTTTMYRRTGGIPHPPVMIVCSSFDVVVVNARDVDDAISHARSQGNARLALLRGWMNQPLIRKYSLNFLINEYLVSLLQQQTLSGLQLAAKSCEILLRGDATMWEHWIALMSKIPGGLFALRQYVPVRDPRLASTFYELILEKMFVEIEEICRGAISFDDRHIAQAKALYMEALLAWGPTSALRERISLIRWRNFEVSDGKANGPNSSIAYEQLAWELFRRKNESATYKLVEDDKTMLDILSSSVDDTNLLRKTHRNPKFVAEGIECEHASKWSNEEQPCSMDALYNMARVAARLARRVTTIAPRREIQNVGEERGDWNDSAASIASEALAELCFMRGEYVEALQLYLVKGANNPLKLDNDALLAVQKKRFKNASRSEADAGESRRFDFVLAMIEHHNLFHCLLESDFLPVVGIQSNSSGNAKNLQAISGGTFPSQAFSPIVALMHLVGLESASSFFVENCTGSEMIHYPSHANLPLNGVTHQLSGRPKLLYWYLQQILTHRPEFYVGISHNMAVPPKEILDLHRTHLELHLKYHHGEAATTSASSDAGPQSLLMDFLRATVLNGTVRPQLARRLIEGKRNEAFADAEVKGLPVPKGLLARELAFVIEKSSRCTDSDAKEVLKLYLDGARSLSLAVAFAERSTEYSALLWETLVSYCLDPENEKNSIIDNRNTTLFGALLECAAQSGADLAHLVSQIPQGMNIKGLRPMLVAAVADYRMKVAMHEKACDAFVGDKISLLRELNHKTRRAARVTGAIPAFEIGPRASSLDGQPTLPSTGMRPPSKTWRHKSRSLEQRQLRERHAAAVPLR